MYLEDTESELTGAFEIFVFFPLNSSLLLIHFSLLHFRIRYALTKEYISSCFDILLQYLGWTACCAVVRILFSYSLSLRGSDSNTASLRGQRLLWKAHKGPVEQEEMTAELACEAQIILHLSSKRTTATDDSHPAVESWPVRWETVVEGWPINYNLVGKFWKEKWQS